MVGLPYGSLYGRAHCNLLQECLCQQTVPARTAAASGPDPGRPLSNHSSAGDSHTLTGKLAQSFVGSLLLSPESWCTQGFACVLQESLFPLVLWKFCNQIPLTFKSGDSQSLCQIPRLGNLMCILEPSQQMEVIHCVYSRVFGKEPWVSNVSGIY